MDRALELSLLVLGALGAGGVVVWRRAYQREVPLSLFGRELPSAEAAARVIGDDSGLLLEQRPEGLGWIAALFLAPIWFIWGDLRTRRPERHLARWSLVGERGARTARITLGPDRERFSVTGRVAAGFSASLDRPFEAQEGLRSIYPVGGTRWRQAVEQLEALRAVGVARVDVDRGALRAERPFDARRELVSYARTFAALEGLTRELEAEV